MSIKDMVSGGKKVKFVRYQQNELWYITECGFEFPVPLYDTNEAAFYPEDKAILFMRWIKKHIDHIAQAQLQESNI